jgi:arylsulfatase A-like enzyme
VVVAGALVVAALVLAIGISGGFWKDEPSSPSDPRRVPKGPVPSFEQQACSLPRPWWLRVQRGYFGPRSGEISTLPRYPAYMASPKGGWPHSGPWPYLQRVPLVFYGPGLLTTVAKADPAVTLADVAPTLAKLIGADFRAHDGRLLSGVSLAPGAQPPRLIVTVVWDGGGWNTLNQWRDAWPNLARMMRDGISFTRATVGSSPSVTPSIHTTLGAGEWPSRHGVTGIWIRDEAGRRVDSFLRGESSRFIEVPTLAERWDESTDNEARIGMVAYEPWHLGMIGMGAERAGGDHDDAAWLDVETNEWTTNENFYRLPLSVPQTGGLDEDLQRLDAADGELDDSWRDNAILDDVDRVEETPAFTRYHTRAMVNMIEDENYGADEVTDLLFTNYKQIDRVGHYVGMASVEVRDAVVETDRQLGELAKALNEVVGRGRWVIVVTADHGQQPDVADIDSYAVDPDEVEADLERHFGPVVDGVFPTGVFLEQKAARERGVTAGEIARWLSDYRLAENTSDRNIRAEGAGSFDPQDRIFELAIPSQLLPMIDCRASKPSG